MSQIAADFKSMPYRRKADVRWHGNGAAIGAIFIGAFGGLIGLIISGWWGGCVAAIISAGAGALFGNALAANRVLKNRVFLIFCVLAASMSLIALAALLITILDQGLTYLSWDFLKEVPSRFPEKAGIGPAMWGTIWVCIVCALIALPLGIGTAIFLEEFQPTGAIMRRAHGFVQLNISNLAGVPSIVYGILGLTVFVQMFGVVGNLNEPAFTIGTREDWYYFQLPLGRSVLAGALTLMLVILPIIIIAAQESLRAVPDSLREGALATGATKWQMVSRMTLPAAIPGIMTGSILAMSRAIGEAAPMLVIAGVVYITFTPENLMDEFTVMPLQIYNWAGLPNQKFHEVAATGIIVLLAILLTFNAIAVFIRQKFHKPLH